MEKAVYKVRMKELRAEARRLKRIIRYRRDRISTIESVTLRDLTICLLDSIQEESVITPSEYCHKCFESRDQGVRLCLHCAKENRLAYTRMYNSIPANKQKRNRILKVKIKTDPMFAMVKRIRGRISSFIKAKGYVKLKSTKEMLGCSYDELMDHIQSQFKDGMGWHNYNEWHIDHRKPLALARNEADLIKLNHYTNLRPMWAIDNLKKGKKYNGTTY